MTKALTLDLSPSEAAFVTGLSPISINKAIDRGEITGQRVRVRSGTVRQVGEAELIYLTLLKDLSSALQRPYRKRLYQALKTRESSKPTRIDLGLVTVDVADAQRRVKERMHQLRVTATWIVSDPEVRGGEPVVRGTRVPVYMLADLTKQGASEGELLEDYPSLTTEGLRAALVYATVTPRRGRPKRAPWHAAAVA